MIRLVVPALLALCALAGCKSVDEYLVDLDTLDPESKRPTFEQKTVVFDAGQLSHEALVGLATAEEMALWQAVRALYHGSRYLDFSRENSLLQSDGAVLIGEVVSKVPIPPIGKPLEIREDVQQKAIDDATALLNARLPLGVPSLISALDSPDEIAAQDAYENLKKSTGEDFGRDAGAWSTWWASVENDRQVAFREASRAPMRRLGQMQFERASDARAILSIMAFWLQVSFDEELTREAVDATMRVARQTAVLSLLEGMKRAKQPIVRADIAEAMGKVRAPEFGDVLTDQLGRERDAQAAAKMIRALRFYPGRNSIVAIFNAMFAGEPQIDTNAAETLRIITGQNFGPEFEAWGKWWESEGSKQWP